ncbi:MAG TPA: isochorismatase family cysteine hydrolase [Clostridia bacterium]|jgi:nicotinamidase-related amidase|nr:isochorismatase family cysteine hydrolase [Clostridia bacterium]HQA98201.1 isochorismatase family cysteine hydrolase [Clostridia bacterium]HQO56726.1 isochorismatase family cysteine hydrolase [Clostridia bacterium]HUM61112.1 isochorismatase family cysteine hydrolase [Clostridia bacterium]
MTNTASGRKLLLVVDMQRDFIDGALGTSEAQAILPQVVRKVRGFDGEVIFTRDTHGEDYLTTQEGRLLPVPHCLRGTEGWQIHPSLEALRSQPAFDKPSFGSLELAQLLQDMHAQAPLESVTLVGLCTDICVISNALIIKAALPEIPVIVDAACCAGVNPQSHRNALKAMAACQVIIENAPDE